MTLDTDRENVLEEQIDDDGIDRVDNRRVLII